MVGLVVEDMGERRAERMGDDGGIGDRAIGEIRADLFLGQRIDEGRKARVLRLPRRP